MMFTTLFYLSTSKNRKPIGLFCKEMLYHIR